MPSESQESKFPSARKIRRRRVGLSQYQEKFMREKLRAAAPSEPWVDAQFVTVRDQDETGWPIYYRYHDPRAFPPGGKKTAMVRCPACGILMPPNAFEQGECLDHSIHRGWGPSPSAVAIAALQYYNLRAREPDLPPEDLTSLRQEIEQFAQTRTLDADKYD
jgi:hypothetical protein